MRRASRREAGAGARIKRVAFLIRSLEYGGAERNLVTLVRALDSSEFERAVFCFYGGGPLEASLRKCGIRVVALGKRGRWELLGFLRRLARELNSFGPHVLHSYLVEPNLAALLVRLFLPRTRLVWGVRASRMELRDYGWFPRVTFRLQCLLSRLPDLIIANSEAGRDYHVARGFPARRVLTIHNGIDTQLFKPDTEAGAGVRAEWGIAPGMKLLGLVARLDPAKDHGTFLRAAALLSQERSDVRFVIVGGGTESYERELRGLADALKLSDRLVWAGARADMPAVYNALDLACSSSTNEGFPNAVGEAMACGVPCVVTKAGDSALLVGETGAVVPAGEPAALAEALRSWLGRDLEALGREARARVVAEFSTEKQARRTEEIFRRVVSGRAKAN